MRDRCTLEGNLDKVLLGVLDTLADSVRNFVGFTETEAYDAVAVAYYHKRGELHDTSALYCLGYTVDSYDFLGKFIFGCVYKCQSFFLLYYFRN